MRPRHHAHSSGLKRAALAALLCGAALAASGNEHGHFSGPSVARVGAQQVFAGKFKPNLPVTIMVRSPSGQESGFSAVTDSDGRLRYPITPDRAGVYTLKVVDSSGKQLVQAQLHVVQ